MASISDGNDQGKSDAIRSVRRSRVLYVIIGACALLVLGLVYAWSIFGVPLGEAFGWDRSLLSYTFSISMVSFCIGALIGSFITQKTSVRVSILTAAALQVSGFILTAIMAPQGIWALYLFYGVFAGLGCGIGYNTILSTVNLWFPDRIGLASGVLMMGFGLGSLILGAVANLLIENLGWNITFFVIGVTSACVLVLLALVLRKPPANIEELLGSSEKKKRSAEVPLEKKPILTSPLFYLYFAWAVLVFGAIMTLMGDSKQGALALGIDAASATLLVGLISLMNGVSRVVIGVIYDHTSLRGSMLIAMAVAFAAIGCIALAFINTLPELYFGAAILAGFASGCIPVMSSSFARERFGAANYAKNLATVNFSIVGSALVSSVVVAIGRPIGGDVAIYTILFGVLILALIDILVFFKLYYLKTA